MDKDLIKQRFAKSLDTYEVQADVQFHIAEVLAEKAQSYLPKVCSSLLEVGCGTGFLSRHLLSRVNVKQLYLNDLVDLSSYLDQIVGSIEFDTAVYFQAGDAECIEFPSQLQAVVSASTLQWLVDLPAFLVKVNKSLLPEGYFIFNTFGPANLLELKTIMGVGIDYPCENELTTMLGEHFNVLEKWEETHVKTFESPRAILRHLKETGVTATKNGFRWTKSNLQNFETIYREKFSKEEKVTLTWQVYYFICKK